MQLNTPLCIVYYVNDLLTFSLIIRVYQFRQNHHDELLVCIMFSMMSIQYNINCLNLPINIIAQTKSRFRTR